MQTQSSLATRRFVKCRIWSGGFSSERTFEIVRPHMDQIQGTAHVQYLRDLTGQLLSADNPPRGQPVDGYVECRIIREISPAHGGVIVEVPSDELLEIGSQDIVEMT